MRAGHIILIVAGTAIVAGGGYYLIKSSARTLPPANPNSHGSATKAGGGSTGSTLASQLLGVFTAGEQAFSAYQTGKNQSQAAQANAASAGQAEADYVNAWSFGL